jgi:hypothetical protein
MLLYQYHAVFFFLLLWLCNIVESQELLFFLHSTTLAVRDLLCFHMNFRVDLSNWDECLWNFDGDCIEHVI